MRFLWNWIVPGRGHRWLYLILAVPTLSEFAETGRGPVSWRDAITDIVLTVVVLAMAWVIGRRSDRLAELATTDPLTGLLNRRAFEDDLRRQVARARRLESGLVLASVDVDRLKRVNDRMGHDAGDALLRATGAILEGAVRRDVDRCYRVGGDEFFMILEGFGREEAAPVLDRVVVAANSAADGLARFGSGVSVGAADLANNESSDDLRARVDRLLYIAKNQGRGRVTWEEGRD